MNLDGSISKEKQKLCGPYEKMQETIGNRNLHVQKYLGLIRFCISSYSLCYHQHNRAKRMRVRCFLGEKILYQWQRKFERRRRLSFAEGLGCAAARLCQIYIPRTLGFLLWGAIWVRGLLKVKGLFGQGRIVFPVQLDWVIEVRSSYHS